MEIKNNEDRRKVSVAFDKRGKRSTKILRKIKEAKLFVEEPKKKILVLGDLHVPFHDEGALLTALKYGKEVTKPNGILILGDFFDFKALSFFLKEQKYKELSKELKVAGAILNQLLELFAEVSSVYWIQGNHEDLVFRNIEKKIPELSGIIKTPFDLLKLLGFEFQNKIKYFSVRETREPLKIGSKLYAIHGHEYTGNWGVINVARNIQLKAQKNVIFGHWHRTQTYIQTGIDGSLKGAWAVGCLSELKPDWKPFNNWNWGFAEVNLYKDGTFSIKNMQIVKKKNKVYEVV